MANFHLHLVYPKLSSSCTAMHFLSKKSVLLHLLEGPELRTHYWVDRDERKSPTPGRIWTYDLSVARHALYCSTTVLQPLEKADQYLVISALTVCFHPTSDWGPDPEALRRTLRELDPEEEEESGQPQLRGTDPGWQGQGESKVAQTVFFPHSVLIKLASPQTAQLSLL